MGAEDRRLKGVMDDKKQHKNLKFPFCVVDSYSLKNSKVKVHF